MASARVKSIEQGNGTRKDEKVLEDYRNRVRGRHRRLGRAGFRGGKIHIATRFLRNAMPHDEISASDLAERQA
jgi:hypothetical protein